MSQYYGTGHVSLDNYIAMLSGQAATPQTRSDCQVYADFVQTGLTPNGQAVGTGCVYPASIKTLPDQLDAVGKTWKAYMGDMGNDPTREAATCGHPVLNSVDHTQAAEAPSASVPLGDQYASRHDPFVYFHSIIDSPACGAHVVNLNVLPNDLKSEFTTPNFVFITPNLCDDGHDSRQFTFKEGSSIDASQLYNYGGYPGRPPGPPPPPPNPGYPGGPGPGRLEIVRAYYGLNNRTNDVTQLLRSMVRGDSLVVQVNNNNMGGDPAIGADKVLTVIYRINGREQTSTVKEGNTLRIP